MTKSSALALNTSPVCDIIADIRLLLEHSEELQAQSAEYCSRAERMAHDLELMMRKESFVIVAGT